MYVCMYVRNAMYCNVLYGMAWNGMVWYGMYVMLCTSMYVCMDVCTYVLYVCR